MMIRVLFFCILSCTAFSKPIKIVASFSILADLVKQVGLEKVDVRTIVGRNGDAHMYEPTPLDVKAMNNADIVFINGLGFEGWIERLIKASGFKGPLVVVGKNIHPRLVFEGRLVEDPHAWHSIPNAIVYIHNIQEALGTKDPHHKAFYEKNAQQVIHRLNAIDASIRQRLSHIPPRHRKIITAHDAFGYFGNSYGVEFLSPVGTNTESEPCAKDMVKLIEAIKTYKVKTIFLENITNPKLIQQLSRETKAKVGPVLYSDALSMLDGPAPTYETMIQYNFERFLDAMKEMG